jgi:hypothetical protein
LKKYSGGGFSFFCPAIRHITEKWLVDVEDLF